MTTILAPRILQSHLPSKPDSISIAYDIFNLFIDKKNDYDFIYGA